MTLIDQGLELLKNPAISSVLSGIVAEVIMRAFPTNRPWSFLVVLDRVLTRTIVILQLLHELLLILIKVQNNVKGGSNGISK